MEEKTKPTCAMEGGKRAGRTGGEKKRSGQQRLTRPYQEFNVGGRYGKHEKRPARTNISKKLPGAAPGTDWPVR